MTSAAVRSTSALLHPGRRRRCRASRGDARSFRRRLVVRFTHALGSGQGEMPVRLESCLRLHTHRSISTPPAAVDAFLTSIADTRILALDTEGASFHRFVDRIYLLQLSTREQTAVIDPLPIGTPAGLGTLLEDPAVEVVFHDADYDLRLLQQDYGWHVRNIFDTRIAAQLLGLRGVRIGRAARQVLRRSSSTRSISAPIGRCVRSPRACSTTRRRTRSTCSSCATG